MEPINFISESSENFNVEFYQNAVSNANGNFVCSALSAYVVLAMAAFGARGNTALQMEKALRISDNESPMLNAFQNFIQEENVLENVELKLANNIFASNKLQLEDSYKKLTSSYFHSGIDQVDFTENEKAVKLVNNWSSAKTNNKINNLIKPGDVDEDTAMILLNAVYFKADWKYKFDVKNTKPQAFNLNKNSKIEVPMMSVKEHFHTGYLEDLDARYVALPYKNEDLMMFIILPNEIEGLSKIESNLEKINFNYTEKISKSFKPEVHLHLPKFKIETTVDLTETLKQLGMIDMFDEEKADFTKISSKTPVVVDKVVQKAFIEVNEEGSEAAVSTAVVTSYLMSAPLRFNFNVDRPFLFKIIDSKRNVSLFSGRITNPLMG